MEQKLDKILEEIVEIKLDLNTHIMRTDQNEEMIKIMKKEFDPVRKAYIGATWAISAILIGLSIAAALSKLL